MNDVNDPWCANQHLLRQQKWLSMYLRKVNFRPPGSKWSTSNNEQKGFQSFVIAVYQKDFCLLQTI